MTLWATRDEPVLRHLAVSPPRDDVLWTNRFSEQPREDFPALTEADFHRAVEVLHDAGHVSWGQSEGEGGGGWAFIHFQVTGAGKQALGLWPLFDALGSPAELAGLLEALGAEASTEEERTNIKRAADAVRRASPQLVKSAAVGALGVFARSQMGL